MRHQGGKTNRVKFEMSMSFSTRLLHQHRPAPKIKGMPGQLFRARRTTAQFCTKQEQESFEPDSNRRGRGKPVIPPTKRETETRGLQERNPNDSSK